MVDVWQEGSFVFDEVAKHLSSVDMYVLSMTIKSFTSHYFRFIFPKASFDVTEIACKKAWSILERMAPHQAFITPGIRQKEFLRNELIITTGPDWAARKGHIELLKWLLVNTNEGCTTYAMDYAARNGHMNVLLWLYDNREEGCTNAAADWAASKGHLHILKWLYAHTSSRCSELAMMDASRRGDLEMLTWLHANGAGCRAIAADYAFVMGHDDVIHWLSSIGCQQSVKDDDVARIERIRECAQRDMLPFDWWD
jgi:hypothetical protein